MGQMRVKLTKVLLSACSLLSLTAFNSPPSSAFPFFHRKPSAHERPVEAGSQPIPATNDTNVAPTAPVFRPYNPTFRPTSPVSPPVRQMRELTPPALPAPSIENSSGRVIPTEAPAVFSPLQPAGGQAQSTIHSPPMLPERPPIPPPPVVQAPIMVSSGDPTPPLSWRAVAYKLWLTPESLPPKRCKSQSSFPFSPAITMKALIKALSEAGWNISQFSGSAGHLLATKSDLETSKMRLVFAAHPGDGGSTVVRAATDPDSKNFDKAKIESIFSRARDIAARKDLL